jgi:hypothetical protein
MTNLRITPFAQWIGGKSSVRNTISELLIRNNSNFL